MWQDSEVNSRTVTTTSVPRLFRQRDNTAAVRSSIFLLIIAGSRLSLFPMGSSKIPLSSQPWVTVEHGVYCCIPTESARIGFLGFLLENLYSVSPPNAGAPPEMPFVCRLVSKTGSEELYMVMGATTRKKLGSHETWVTPHARKASFG